MSQGEGSPKPSAEKYGVSQESKSDHGCFVFGKSTSKPYAYENDGKSSNMRNDEVSWYNDLTAVVEIKLDKTRLSKKKQSQF